MLPIGKTHEFTVNPDEEDEKEKRTYLIQVPTRRERIAFQHEVASQGAQLSLSFDADFFRVMRDGIKKIVDGEEQQKELLELVAQYEALEMPRDEKCDPDLLENISEIKHTLLTHYRPFARQSAATDHYLNVASLTACQMFLIGRKGERPLPRKGVMVTEKAMDGISETDIILIGYEAMKVMRPTKEQEKN